MPDSGFCETRVLVQGSRWTVERLVGELRNLGKEAGAIVTEINPPETLPQPTSTLSPLELTTPACDLIPGSVLRNLAVSNWVLADMLEQTENFAITIFGHAAVDRIKAAGYSFAEEPQQSCR